MDKSNTKKDMMLESASGFVMPFTSDEPVQVSLFYGDQIHPRTGEKFWHKGWDFVADHVPLYAVASGLVVGVGNDKEHDNYIVTRYGKYEIKYGHVVEAYCNYGSPVVAGQQIAKSGEFLHLDVRFDGEYVDPREFVTILLANVEQLESLGIKQDPRFMNIQSKTEYDAENDEITQMMLRYLPSYFADMRSNTYRTPLRVQQSLRNIFGQAADRNYLYEEIPNMTNPLGLSGRAAPLAGKVQNVLIEDFLNYMAMRHNTYLSSWSNAQKKNFLSKQKQIDS